jgi:hypothetical protein
MEAQRAITATIVFHSQHWGGAMACGDNHIGRDNLSSDPKGLSATSSELFAAPPAAKGFPRAPESEKWGGKDRQMYYSQGSLNRTEYFIGPDGNLTFAPDRHVHVIHNEKDKEVILVLTDRTQTAKEDPHLNKLILPGNPSGNEVNDAIAAMVKELNDLPRGPEAVIWP